jgi:hypothetical protein
MTPTPPPSDEQQRPDISLFLKNVWFFLFYFALLLLIASFGLVAEA